MRIIAGEWKGRRIAAPKGDAVRPTLDRVREAWMSIVQGDLPGARVLDLFAGSGALGLEALSRGAEHVDFVENDPRTIRTLKENIMQLGAGDRCTVHAADALQFVDVSRSTPHVAVRRTPYGVAFADPPYRLGLATQLAARWLQRPFSTIFGVEHAANESDSLPEGGDCRRYGDTAITIFRS